MFGSGEKFSSSGIVFSQQLVTLYTKTLGDWSFWIISITAFMTMLSTTLTVIDAYPRTLDVSMKEIFTKTKGAGEKSYWGWVIFNVILALIIIGMLTNNMKELIDFATILSFLAAPVFAFINYKVVTGSNIDEAFRPPKWLRLLSGIGIVFLVLFSLIYLYSIVIL
jgi:Mn2+/Fe2+ NRAMP family transporter